MLSFEERTAEWRRRFDEQRASGLTVSAWCREQGITKNTFYGWRKRLSESPVVSVPQFIAVAVERQPSAPACLPAAQLQPSVPDPSRLTLRIGRIAVEVASGFDPVLLDDILGVLESRKC